MAGSMSMIEPTSPTLEISLQAEEASMKHRTMWSRPGLLSVPPDKGLRRRRRGSTEELGLPPPGKFNVGARSSHILRQVLACLAVSLCLPLSSRADLVAYDNTTTLTGIVQFNGATDFGGNTMNA